MSNLNTKKAYRGEYRTDEEVDLDDPTVRVGIDSHAGPAPEDVEHIELPPEEKTFKQRYGDLRTYQQEREKSLNDRITSLEGQLKEATKKEFVFPKSEEELKAWAEQYPDVFGYIETIAMKKIADERASLEDRLVSVEKMRAETVKERAEQSIRQKHPDFDELRESEAFHKWAEKQPSWVHRALYEEDDPFGVVRAIDLYKFDNNLNKPTKASTAERNREAAKTVRSSGNRPELTEIPGGGNGKILESDVKRMTPRQFEKMEDTIMEAIRNGTFVYDVSGGAR